MSAFLNISIWVALATVIPGLVTIAAICGAYAIAEFSSESAVFNNFPDIDNWMMFSVAVAIMILTQALGILLEDVLVRLQKLGPDSLEFDIPKGIDPRKPQRKQHVGIKPYEEYAGVYVLLAELREDEDTQGHLKRACAQFFLTNNTMISFAAGIVIMGALIINDCSILKSGICFIVIDDGSILKSGIYYIVGLIACLVVTFRVAQIRFEVMAKALWATRRRRIDDMAQSKKVAKK